MLVWMVWGVTSPTHLGEVNSTHDGGWKDSRVELCLGVNKGLRRT